MVLAPKARNVTAWGNAPGDGQRVLEALKARNRNYRSKTAVVKLPLNIISRLQRWDAPTAPYLGRWPRLLHFAPLALRPAITDRTLRGRYLDCFMNDPRYRLLPD